MKKFVLFLMVLVMGATLAIGQQMSNPADIMQMIWRSAEFQRESGIIDPNLIFPGQTLTYSFTDGTTETITVQPGDNQWTVVRDKLGKLQQKHGPVVDPPVKSEPPVVEKKKQSVFQQSGFPWWLWIFIGVVAFVFLGWIVSSINKSKEQKTDNTTDVDPTTTGPAFVPGGIRPENAENHFRTLTERSNPGANIIIKDVRPGFLSTAGGLTALVGYVDGTNQSHSFRNIPGFRAEVSLDGGITFHKEYYFGACGNPVRTRRSFGEDSGLIFSEQPINFGENQVPVSSEVLVAKERASVELENPKEDNDLFVISNDQASVAEQFLKTQKAHKVTMVYERWVDGHVKIESIFETKNASIGKKPEK